MPAILIQALHRTARPCQEAPPARAYRPPSPDDRYELPRAPVVPETRGDCINGPRPCPYYTCTHHLYLELKDTHRRHTGEPLKIHEMPHSCSLDVADQGGLTLEVIAAIFGVTRERIRQLEAGVKRRLKLDDYTESTVVSDMGGDLLRAQAQSDSPRSQRRRLALISSYSPPVSAIESLRRSLSPGHNKMQEIPSSREMEDDNETFWGRTNPNDPSADDLEPPLEEEDDEEEDDEEEDDEEEDDEEEDDEEEDDEEEDLGAAIFEDLIDEEVPAGPEDIGDSGDAAKDLPVTSEGAGED
jgi:hypothetical protein